MFKRHVVTVAMAVAIATGDPLFFEMNSTDDPASCTYKLYSDGVLATPALYGVSCSVPGGSLKIATCQAPLPPIVGLGPHTLTVAAVCSGQAEGYPSNALDVLVGLPKAAQPHNLRTTAQ